MYSFFLSFFPFTSQVVMPLVCYDVCLSYLLSKSSPINHSFILSLSLSFSLCHYRLSFPSSPTMSVSRIFCHGLHLLLLGSLLFLFLLLNGVIIPDEEKVINCLLSSMPSSLLALFNLIFNPDEIFVSHLLPYLPPKEITGVLVKFFVACYVTLHRALSVHQSISPSN